MSAIDGGSRGSVGSEYLYPAHTGHSLHTGPLHSSLNNNYAPRHRHDYGHEHTQPLQGYGYGYGNGNGNGGQGPGSNRSDHQWVVAATPPGAEGYYAAGGGGTGQGYGPYLTTREQEEFSPRVRENPALEGRGGATSGVGAVGGATMSSYGYYDPKTRRLPEWTRDYPELQWRWQGDHLQAMIYVTSHPYRLPGCKIIMTPLGSERNPSSVCGLPTNNPLYFRHFYTSWVCPYHQELMKRTGAVVHWGGMGPFHRF